MRVFYDAWPLVRNPISPSSLHLLAILENLPDEIDPLAAFPEPVPKWMGDIPAHIRPTPNTPSGRLRWEQVRIGNYYSPRLLVRVRPIRAAYTPRPMPPKSKAPPAIPRSKFRRPLGEEGPLTATELI